MVVMVVGGVWNLVVSWRDVSRAEDGSSAPGGPRMHNDCLNESPFRRESNGPNLDGVGIFFAEVRGFEVVTFWRDVLSW